MFGTIFFVACVIILVVQMSPQDINYDRPKDPKINDTPINITLFASEQPTALAAVAAGTSGVLEAEVRADADESGGADVQTLYKIVATPTIAVQGGETSLQIDITPVNGDGSDGALQSFTVSHPETMDAWQAAAGRAQQP